MTEPLVAFAHIPKAAGTTVWVILRNVYGRKHIKRFRGIGMPATNAAMTDTILQGGHDLQAIGGHVRVNRQLVREHGVRFITMLRDPTKIQFSRFLKHTAVKKPDVQVTDEYILSRFPAPSNNPLVRFLRHQDGYEGEALAKAPVTRDDLERAKETLATLIHSFGLVERFDESLDQFRIDLGWSEVPQYESKNPTPNKPRSVPDHVWETGRENNALDYELYAFAEKLFDERRAAARASSPAPEAAAHLATSA